MFRSDFLPPAAHIHAIERMKKQTPVSRSGRFAHGPGADVAAFSESISFDWRLWLRDEIIFLLGEITELQKSLVPLGEKTADVLTPGYTPLQRAQPVYSAHHALAYVEMRERDCDRLWDCWQRVNVCPLG